VEKAAAQIGKLLLRRSLASGMSADDFVKEFSWITKEDVQEALSFAATMLSGRYIPLQKAS